jgi:hypothetical protein
MRHLNMQKDTIMQILMVVAIVVLKSTMDKMGKYQNLIILN